MRTIRKINKNSVWFQGAIVSLLITIITTAVFISNKIMATLGQYVLTFGALFIIWWLLSTFIIWAWRNLK